MVGEGKWLQQCFWRHAARFPPEFRGRCSHSQTIAGGKLVIIGGGYVEESGAGFTHCNDVLVFDLATQEYVVVESSPEVFLPRRSHSAVLKGEHEIVVFGGVATVSDEEEDELEMGQLLEDVMVFDLRTLSWSNPRCYGALPPPRRGHAACMHNDAMVMFGGFSIFMDPRIYSLDTNTWEWTRIVGSGIVPDLHDIMASCKLNNRLYVYGGGHNVPRVTPAMYCLDLQCMEWHELPMRGDLDPMRFCAATALLGSRYLVVFGGGHQTRRRDMENLNDVMVLDLSDPWSINCTLLTPKGQPPARRNAAAMSVVGGVAIITGGGVYSEGYFDDIWTLDFELPQLESSQHAVGDTSVLHYFAELYLEPRFADVTLLVHNQQIPAHKVVLAARSEYFRSLFHGRFSEAVQQSGEIVLHDMALEPFMLVLRFLYSGQPSDEMFASQESLLGVIECAQMLGVDSLVRSSEEQLMALAADIADLKQILPFLQIAETYELNRLYWRCMQRFHRFYRRALLQRAGDMSTADRSLLQQVQSEDAYAVLAPITKQRIEHAETELLCVSVITVSDTSPIRPC